MGRTVFLTCLGETFPLPRTRRRGCFGGNRSIPHSSHLLWWELLGFLPRSTCSKGGTLRKVTLFADTGPLGLPAGITVGWLLLGHSPSSTRPTVTPAIRFKVLGILHMLVLKH